MSVTLVYADHELVLLAVQLGPLEEIHDSKLPIRLSTQFFVIIVGLRNEGHVWRGVNHCSIGVTSNRCSIQAVDGGLGVLNELSSAKIAQQDSPLSG